MLSPHSPRRPSHDRIARRRFLAILGAGGALGAVAVGQPVRLLGRDASLRAVAGRVRDDGVVALGRVYVRDHPDEADIAFLTSHLPGVDATSGVRGQLPDLATTVSGDFAAERMVTVDGWVLALSEARAAGAVALGA